VAFGIAALDDEVGDDAVEVEAVEVALGRELQEVEAGERRLRAGQAEGDRPPRGADLHRPRLAGALHDEAGGVHLLAGGWAAGRGARPGAGIWVCPSWARLSPASRRST